MAFTGDELLSLAALPHLIGAAAASVSPSGVFGTAKEFFANSRALLEGAESYPQNRLIRQLVPGIAESHSEATASVQKVRDWTADRMKASGVDSSDKATRRDGRPTLVVGCTTERANAIENGRAKFREAGCDLILIVDESPAAESLISDLLTVHLVEGDKVEMWSRLGSNEIVRRLMELLAARLAATSLHEGE